MLFLSAKQVKEMLLPLACNHRRHREFHAVVGCNPTLSHGHYPTLNPFLHWLTALLEDVAVTANEMREGLSVFGVQALASNPLQAAAVGNQKSVSDSSGDKQCNNLSMALWHAA